MARVLLVAALALLWVGFGPTSAEAANPAADIEQCRNGQFGSPEQCTGGAWQTGNAGASNSHYREGDSVPFRAVLTNLSTSGTHSVVIEYDTLDSGAHAYDYLTSFDRTETTAAPCSGISPCVPGSAGAIPVDPTIAFANPDSTQVSGAISIWNGAITSVAYGSADAAGKRSVTVSFTATDARVVVAWGGHIASQIDWGAGNSAGSISGSPYHMRLLDLDGDGLGNMDRSLSAASVAPVPATFTTQVSSASITLGQPVTDLASLSGPNGVVSGNVSFFVCGPDVVSNPSCASGGSAVGSAVGLAGGQATSPQFVPTQAGKYCFRAEYAPDMFAQYSPSEHTNLTTECFEAVLPLGTLRVIKKVVNDNGGSKAAGDFNLHVKSGSADVLNSPAAGSATGVVYTLASGSYTVSEDTPPAGYAQTGFSGDCDAGGVVTVAAGVEKTCTITNDDQAAKLVVFKHVVNDNGGGKVAGDFPISVTGSSPSPASFNGSESGTQVAIQPGSFSVSETEDAGYAASYAGCSGSIALGETKTCTITNDDKAAKLVVIKHVINDEGGTRAASDFAITVTGGSPAPASFSGAEAPGTDVAIGPGSYEVTEGAHAGYEVSYSDGCAGSIALGQTKTCTITNDDDVAPSVTVEKTASPTSVAEPGGMVAFSITVVNTSKEAVTLTSLTDDVYGDLDGKGTCLTGGSLAASDGAPGGPDEYSCAFSANVDGNAGSTHTDVVTAIVVDDEEDDASDTDDAVVRITDVPGSIVVTKTADPVSLPEPGGNVTFSVEIDNTSASDAVTISSLVDDVYGNLDAKGTCDVPVTIAVGASYSCSFQGEVEGNAGSAHTDVVTVSGTDDDGTPVADDDDAVVTLTNTPSSIVVTKTADPVSLPEPGGNATFSVKVDNTSAVDAVMISSLTDDIYGNLDGKGTCDVPKTIAAGASYSCSFQGAVSGNAGSSHKDVVTASGSDDDGNAVSDDDDATVTLTNLPSSIAVTKTADPVSLPEPGGNATFSVKVENTSAVDAVTISSLADDVYGNLDGKGSCDVPQTIAAGQSYTCSFDGAVSGNAGSSHKDVVTASGNDDDGNALSDHDDAIVAITNVASSIAVTKSADPVSLPEPGGQATFSVKVENTSAVDSVTISSLADDVYGNLDGKGTCDVPKTIAAGASYNCSFQGAVSGNAGSSHKDVVTASGTDDDGNPLSGQDDAVVSITNVASSIAVTKTASPTSIQEPGGQVAFSVKVDNTSATDAVTISGLVDDVFGNLDGKGTCDVPRTIAAGSSYSCSFSANVSGTGGSTHRDVVTASGSDDDGNPVSAQDDATVAITSAPVPPPPAPPAPPAPLAPPAPPAPKAIDLSIVKTDRPDPVFVGGRLTYTLSVRNAGPDTATNVSLADPLPAGTRFVSVRTTQGSCNGGPLVTCNLGSIAPASRVLVTIVVRALEAGALINTATVVGNEPEANTANNSSTAPTLVRGPFRPPVVTCPALTVQPRTLALGKKGVVKAVVTRAGKGVRGVRIVVSGPGLKKAATTDGRGRVGITVRPPRAGIATIRMANEPARCSTRRVGVVGVFLPPPVTG